MAIADRGMTYCNSQNETKHLINYITVLLISHIYLLCDQVVTVLHTYSSNYMPHTFNASLSIITIHHLHHHPSSSVSIMIHHHPSPSSSIIIIIVHHFISPMIWQRTGGIIQHIFSLVIVELDTWIVLSSRYIT